MSGRLAPSKFLREILDAMVLLRRRLPGAELHVIGGAEPRHAGYARDLLTIARADLDRTVFFLGPDAGAPERLAAFDAAVVIGEDQGCPNACLEALAAGVPLVANDSGGTRELVVPRRTGWLVPDTSPAAIASALLEALTSPERAGDCVATGPPARRPAVLDEPHDRAIRGAVRHPAGRSMTCECSSKWMAGGSAWAGSRRSSTTAAGWGRSRCA